MIVQLRVIPCLGMASGGFRWCESDPRSETLPNLPFDTLREILGAIENQSIELDEIGIMGGDDPIKHPSVLEMFDLCIGRCSKISLSTLGTVDRTILRRLEESALTKLKPNPHSLYYRFMPLRFNTDSSTSSWKRLNAMLDVCPNLAIFRLEGSSPEDEQGKLDGMLKERGYRESTYLYQDIEHPYWVRGNHPNEQMVFDFPYDEVYNLGSFKKRKNIGKIPFRCSLKRNRETITLSSQGLSPCWHTNMSLWPATLDGLKDMMNELSNLQKLAHPFLYEGGFDCDECPVRKLRNGG